MIYLAPEVVLSVLSLMFAKQYVELCIRLSELLYGLTNLPLFQKTYLAFQIVTFIFFFVSASVRELLIRRSSIFAGKKEESFLKANLIPIVVAAVFSAQLWDAAVDANPPAPFWFENLGRPYLATCLVWLLAAAWCIVDLLHSTVNFIRQKGV